MSSEIEEIRQRKIAELVNSASQAGGNDLLDAPVTLTDTNFEEVIKKHQTVVVDCWAPWCGPCRMLSPTIEAMAKDYKGKAVFAKLNTDENIGVASKYRIMSIPTLLYFRDGKLVDKTVGALPRPMLDTQMRKVLG
jgi:thioredoxin 1